MPVGLTAATPFTVGVLFRQSTEDLRRTWRALVITDLAFKAIAFAILMPAVTWLLHSFLANSGGVVADVEIARFFLTPVGLVALILGSSLIVAIAALEMACLMAIGFARA